MLALPTVLGCNKPCGSAFLSELACFGRERAVQQLLTNFDIFCETAIMPHNVLCWSYGHVELFEFARSHGALKWLQGHSTLVRQTTGLR